MSAAANSSLRVGKYRGSSPLDRGDHTRAPELRVAIYELSRLRNEGDDAVPKGIFERLHLYRVIIIGYSLFVLGLLFFLAPFIIDLTNGQEAFLRVLGTAFLSGGLISLINEHFLRHSMIDEMTERFDVFLSDNIDDLYRRRGARASCPGCPTKRSLVD